MTYLFVYGTLIPGEEAWPLLEPWTTGPVRADAARGRLYDTRRGYPAATFAPDAPGLVHGTVVELDAARADAALAALDAYEAEEYVRVGIVTDGGIEAVTYAWIAPLDRCDPVTGGRWRGA